MKSFKLAFVQNTYDCTELFWKSPLFKKQVDVLSLEHKGLSIYYVCKIIQKTSISYPLKRISTVATYITYTYVR